VFVSGKTEFLLQMMVKIVLPKDWNGVAMNGFEAGVIIIDTDHKFSIIRLASLIERFVNKRVQNTGISDISTTVDIEKLINECLERVFVVKCSSSAQLVVTIHNLESLICSHPCISAVMLDSVSSFYWTDRANGGDSTPAQEANMRLATEALAKLVNTYSLVLFATKFAVFKKKASDFSDNTKVATDVKAKSLSVLLSEDFDQHHAEFMCKAWQRFVSHRLILISCEDDVFGDETDNRGHVSVIGGDCATGNKQIVITQHGLTIC